MSNLIKSHYVNVGQDKKVIGWGNGFQTLSASVQEIKSEEEANALAAASSETAFSEGLDPAFMQRVEEEELVSEKTERLLLEANEAAERIIEDAKAEAEAIRLQVMEEGRQAGYAEGFEQGQSEVKNLELELREQQNAIQDDYCRMVEELEPKFATVVVSLVEKLTGIVAEEHKSVIMHLIRQGVSGVVKSKNFLIKVSSEDYQAVAARKDEILSMLSENVELHIIEEEDFVKNQCYVEADGKLIDCSLDVQMKSLITDLKLLACLT